MKSKRFLSIILVFVMVFAMAVTACGKKEEAAEKEEPKQEEKVETTESEEVDETEKAEDPDDAEDAASQIDTTKEQLTDEDVEALKASIAETVTKEYLEPNNVAVADFKWPETDSVEAWEYFNGLKMNYMAEQFLKIEPSEISIIPTSPNKEIVDALFNGVIAWYKASGVDNRKYFENALSVLQPDVINSIDLAAYK